MNAETTWFEGRELKDYAEPVSATELVKGASYFTVTFVDEDLLIPSVEPLVFIGKDLEDGDVGRYYFQEAHSYRDGLGYASKTDQDREVFQVYASDGMKHIFEYERALDVLMRCALSRRVNRQSTIDNQK
ncbi:MAG: hypothetical protein ACRD3E_05440 [Terriglobales bacterium]